MPMLFLLLFGLVQTSLCRTELIDVVCTHGFLNRASARVGVLVEFDGPLRISKKQHDPIEIGFENETDNQIFGIFPSTNVTSRRKFGLFVKDPTLLPPGEIMDVTLIAHSTRNKRQRIKVTIHMEDGELEAPELDSLEYNIYVAEFETSGILKKFKIRNANRSMPDKFIYKLTGEHSNLFSVDPVNPDQILFSKVGCGKCSQHRFPKVFPLLLTVYSNKTNVLPAKTLFIIHKASTLKTSHFKDPAVFNFTLRENSAKFEELARIETPDGGVEENTFFQLESSRGHFEINQRNGVLSVKKPVTQKELGNQTTLHVQLRSVSNQSQVLDDAVIRIKIEKSDELPPGRFLQFDQKIYAFALTPDKTRIGQVSVEHPMDVVRYRIVEGSAGEIEMDEVSGQLTYTGPHLAQSRNFTLKVIAVAGDQTDLCSVQILIAGLGSNPPRFKKDFQLLDIDLDNLDRINMSNVFTFKAESADKKAKLYYKVIDIECVDSFGQKEVLKTTESVSKNCRNNIELRPDNGSLLLNPGILSSSFYSIRLTVEAREAQSSIGFEAKAQLLIRFKRNRPKLFRETTVQFDKHILLHLKIPRNLIEGSYVQTVSVKALEHRSRTRQNIQFDLGPSSSGRYFQIDQKTGIITTKGSLNRAPSHMNISVTARNLVDLRQNSLNISVQLIDSHREVPTFADEFLDFYIADGSDRGKIVGSVGTAAITNTVYKIVDDDSKRLKNYFNITSRSGIIIVTNKVSASIFGTRQLNFIVSATNSLSNMSSLLPIHVHLTAEPEDEAPKFAHTDYNLKLMENAPVGTFVARFQVRFSSQLPDERIEAPLKFAISPENEHSKRMVSLLFVDQSGVLRTTGMLNQMNGMYSLTVTVIHSSRNNTAKINSMIGKFVALTQKDCGLIYELDSPFVSINSLTGEVHIKNRPESTRRRYPLIVRARSGSQVSRLSAELRVQASNPKTLLERNLHYQVPENSKIDTTVGWLTAESNSNVKFRLLNATNDFVLDPTTGRLKTKQLLDREQNNEYHLAIEVIDPMSSKRVDSANVVVDVLDVNDNAPKFLSDTFDVVLEKTATPGQTLFTLRAVDPDKNEATRLVYKLESQVYHQGRTSSALFDIPNPIAGDIVLLKSIRDVEGMFELVVSASNLLDDITHISRAIVRIWICDSSNVGKFIFEQRVRDLHSSGVAKYLHDLEAILQVKPILKDVKFHVKKDGPNSDAVVLEIIFVNPRTKKIISFARVEKRLMNSEQSGIKLLDYVVEDEDVTQQLQYTHPSSVSTASLLIAALVFCFLLCVIVAIFVAIVYSHRKRFKEHKRICENIKAAATKHVPHFSEFSDYKTIDATRLNSALMQEIERSSTTSTYGIGIQFPPESSTTTRQQSIDLR